MSPTSHKSISVILRCVLGAKVYTVACGETDKAGEELLTSKNRTPPGKHQALIWAFRAPPPSASALTPSPHPLSLSSSFLLRPWLYWELKCCCCLVQALPWLPHPHPLTGVSYLCKALLSKAPSSP